MECTLPVFRFQSEFLVLFGRQQAQPTNCGGREGEEGGRRGEASIASKRAYVRATLVKRWCSTSRPWTSICTLRTAVAPLGTFCPRWSRKMSSSRTVEKIPLARPS